MIIKCHKCGIYVSNVFSICNNHRYCKSCFEKNKLKCHICTPSLKRKPNQKSITKIQYLDNNQLWNDYIPIYSKKIINKIFDNMEKKIFNGNYVINKNITVYWGKNINSSYLTLKNPTIFLRQKMNINTWKKNCKLNYGIIIQKNKKNNTITLLRIN